MPSAQAVVESQRAHSVAATSKNDGRLCNRQNACAKAVEEVLPQSRRSGTPCSEQEEHGTDREQAAAGGRCIESVTFKGCSNYEKLMSKRDAFKHDLTGNGQHAVKRTLVCAAISKSEVDQARSGDRATPGRASKQVIALCDQTGILQMNNFTTGNLITSLSNKRNKAEISAMHIVDKAQMSIAAACLDGTIMFILKQTLQPGQDF